MVSFQNGTSSSATVSTGACIGDLAGAATGSTRHCMMEAMPYIAQWSGEHPNVAVTRWRCVRPGAAGDGI